MSTNGSTAMDLASTTAGAGAGSGALAAGAGGVVTTGVTGSGFAAGRRKTNATNATTATASPMVRKGGFDFARAAGALAGGRVVGRVAASLARLGFNRRFTCSTNCEVGSPPGR